MSVAFVGPNLPMSIGGGQLALWTPLRVSAGASGTVNGGPLPTSVAGLVAWWDASSVEALLDAGGNPIMGWRSLVGSLANKCPAGGALTPYSFGPLSELPAATPRLNRQLGGIGRIAGTVGGLTPALDPDLGIQELHHL